MAFGRKCSRSNPAKASRTKGSSTRLVRIWLSSMFFRAVAKFMMTVQAPEKTMSFAIYAGNVSKTMPSILTRRADPSKFRPPRRWRGRSAVKKRIAETFRNPYLAARWQSGYAEACKALYVGSIPARASRFHADPA